MEELGGGEPRNRLSQGIDAVCLGLVVTPREKPSGLPYDLEIEIFGRFDWRLVTQLKNI